MKTIAKMASTAVNKIVNGIAPAEQNEQDSPKPDATKEDSENAGPSVETPAEVTKRSIRVQTWRKIQDKKIAPSFVFNRIPKFVDVDKAIELLVETPEFKAATNIKVDLDRSQDLIKLQVLAASKNLYISTGKESQALYAKVNCEATQDVATQKKAILVDNLSEYGTEIAFQDKVELDMVIYGSVAVSKLGQRIGRGNGYVDLDFAILKHCGSITDKTLIVTLVHDEQLYDTLPAELFTNLDVPLDLIVTPTQVVRVAKRLPRPAGIKWSILSQRRLGVVPVLQAIKDEEIKNGKTIDLKDEDTDVETNRRPKSFRRYGRAKKSRAAGEETAKTNEDSTTTKIRHRKKGKNVKKGENKSKPKNGDTDDGLDTDGNEVEGEGEPTKRSLRLQTWRRVENKRLSVYPFNIYPYNIYNKVPNFIGGDQAANLLAETEEFKNAKHIKVNSDRAQDPAKIKIVSESKNLYVAAPRESSALYAKINCPADADEETKNKAVRNQNLGEYGTEIDLANKVALDMLIIGAVVVDRLGRRIGRGNGYVDLDFGILTQAGVITDKTVVVCTVHDIQVVDSLPEELFKEYDVPVDIIVTPTEVIRIEKRLPRPAGIYWNLLSKRRINIVPVLQVLKEIDEKNGKEIILKEYDTDVEDNKKGKPRRRFFGRRTRVSKKEVVQLLETRRHPHKYGNRKVVKPRAKAPPRQDLIETEVEQKKKQKKRRDNRDYCIKVSNIPKSIRIKEFKSELREKGCNPMFISWKGSYHACYLHFNKQELEENAEEAVAGIISNLQQISLNDVSVTSDDRPTPAEGLKLEWIKRQPAPPAQPSSPSETSPATPPQSRIESVDVTKV